MFGNIVYIGIGSNLGDAIENVTAAMDSLGRLPDTRLEKTSSLYRTTPIDADGDDYVNAVAMLSTGLSSGSLLDALLQIEQTFGRQRPYRNAPRTLDLDMLLYNADCISTERLTIPHPRMMERAGASAVVAEGTESAYGLFITTVDGETADDSLQQWWCITRSGEMLSTGADQTPIADGEQYELTLTEGY